MVETIKVNVPSIVKQVTLLVSESMNAVIISTSIKVMFMFMYTGMSGHSTLLVVNGLGEKDKGKN